MYDYGKQTTLENIAALNAKLSSAEERRIAHINELAIIIYTIAAGESDGYARIEDLRESYASVMNEINSGRPPEAEFNSHILDGFYSSMSCLDKVALCRAMMALSEYPYTLEDFFGREMSDSSGRISYLRNPYTDKAYSTFSKYLNNPTVRYCDDFVSVCEDVYYGRAGLCILPLENSSEGRLVSFSRLISRYELHIVMECSVETGHESSTRFALLKNSVARFPISDGIPHRGYIELRISPSYSVRDILNAAENYGLEAERIDCVPDSAEGHVHCIRFLTDSGDLDGFLYFLQLEAPHITTTGVFYSID